MKHVMFDMSLCVLLLQQVLAAALEEERTKHEAKLQEAVEVSVYIICTCKSGMGRLHSKSNQLRMRLL